MRDPGWDAARLRRVFHPGLILVLFLLQFLVPPFHRGLLTQILVFGTYALGYNLLLGYTGLMSLGHAMFFASGMYATGLAVYYVRAGAAESCLLGLAASVAVAVVMGLVTLRTRGVSFLIVTLLFAQVFYLSTLYFNRVTGGDQGLVLAGRLRPLHIGVLDVAVSDPVLKYNAALALFALCLLLTLWLIRSPVGRVLVAVRENEERTRLLGYDTFRYKLLAFVLSGGISGAAGSVYALLFSYLGSSFASILYSIYPLLWTLLGGVGTAAGPLVGTAVMTYVVDTASGLTDSYLIVVGAALIAVIMKFPAGLMGGARARWLPWLP